MQIFTKSSIVLATALAVGTICADAKVVNGTGRVDLTKFCYKADISTAFTGKRADNIEALNAKLNRAAGRPVKAQSKDGDSFTPDFTLGPGSITGDLDGPNGERWFYTATYDYTEIPPDYDNGIWYTDYILQSFRYDVYDSKLNLVGTIKDTVDYADDEVRVPSIEIVPVVSRNFFNTDDKIEIMVAIAMNTDVAGMNRYHTYIYSIGDTDGNGDSKPIDTFDSLLGDVIEGPATSDGKDNFYMTFLTDHYPDADDDTSFWDYLSGASINADVYGRALDASGPRKLLSKEIKLLNLPGDQESAAFIISLNRGNDVYFVFSSLEEPLWDRYDDPINDDLVQRENNVLDVEFYKTDGNELTYQYTTRIAADRIASSDQDLATFYSIGGLRYELDIDFDNYGTPEGRAALIVTRENYDLSTDSNIPSYIVYDYRGNIKTILAENCDGNLALSDIPGFPPQHLFISTLGYSYYFSFVNLLTGEEDFGISSQYEIEEGEEAEGLLANLDRVAVGDSYKYAIEMQAPLYTENEDNIMRILWIDKDGGFDHIDGVNMGKNVQYAQAFIESKALDPKSFYSDDIPEYLILIKRGNPGENLSEDLLLAQITDDEYNGGKELLLIQPDSERGEISGIVPDMYSDTPNLTIYYMSGSGKSDIRYTQEIYMLPLDNQAGIENIISGKNVNGITVNGTIVSATGDISVYNTAGLPILRGKDLLDVSALQPGIYIVAAAGSTVKIAVK